MTFEQRPSTTVRTSVVSLFAANGASFLIVGLSYVLYSRYLTPADFGLYSAALAIAAFGTLVLDGGLKNTIIKARTTPTREEQGTLLFLMMMFSLVLVGGIALLQRPLVQYFPAARLDLFAFLSIPLDPDRVPRAQVRVQKNRGDRVCWSGP